MAPLKDDAKATDVEVSDLTVSYGTLRALGPISFAVKRNKVMGVIGPSGCGKSTLLYAIGGLLQPTSGSVKVRHDDPTQLLGTGQIGFVFQDAALLPWRTVEDNVRLPLDLIGKADASSSLEVNKLISLVGLSSFSKARPRELSGGMKKRAAFARSLVTHPSILLLDEPFGELDEALRSRLMIELEKIWLERPVTAVLVTHNVREAIFLCDEIISLSSRPGRISTIVKVPVDRPRGRSFLTTNLFHELYDAALESLLSEPESP